MVLHLLVEFLLEVLLVVGVMSNMVKGGIQFQVAIEAHQTRPYKTFLLLLILILVKIMLVQLIIPKRFPAGEEIIMDKLASAVLLQNIVHRLK